MQQLDRETLDKLEPIWGSLSLDGSLVVQISIAISLKRIANTLARNQEKS